MNRYAPVLLVLALVVLSSRGFYGQNPPPRGGPAQQPPGTAVLSGAVVAMGTGEPLAGAVVEARRLDCNNFSTPPDVLTATTAADGKFVFRNVRAGGWCVVASMPGGAYTPAEFQQRGVLGRGLTIPVSDNQTISDIRLAMAPTGVLSGRVVDRDGEPMAFVRVQAMERFHQDGEARLYILQVAQTDDRGEYRFYWLPPGRYYLAVVPQDTRRSQVVSVQPPPGMGGRREDVIAPVVVRRIAPTGEVSEETYVTVYYPGEIDPKRAAPVEVQAGRSVGGLDFLLSAGRVPSYHVRGTILNSVTGLPAEGAQVRVVSREWTSTVVMPTATADADGNFDVGGVVSGAYVVYATQSIPDPNPPPPPPDAPNARPPQLQVNARLAVNVSGRSIDGTKLVLGPPSAIAGRVVSEIASPNGLPRGLTVSLARVPDLVGLPASAPRAAVQPDGTFQIANVAVGDYRIYVAPILPPFQWGMSVVPAPLQNAYVRSVRRGGTDVLGDGLKIEPGAAADPLEVVLGEGGRLAGQAFNERREPMANVTVAVIPEAGLRKRPDLYRSAATDASGRYQVQGIAPGSYKVFAWEEVERDAWQDAEFLRPVEGRGSTVEIRAREQSSMDVTAIPAARP